jgi:hypothetical protein
VHENPTPCRQGFSLALKGVTSFVTRRGWKGKEGTGMYRLNGTIQDIGSAKEIGETVAIASILKKHAFPLLISGP